MRNVFFMLVFLIFSSFFSLQAQVEEEVYSLVKTIPRLDSLIELALKNAPLIKAKNSKMTLENENLKVVKMKWMDKVFSDVSYFYTNGFNNLNLSTGGNNVETASLQKGDNYRAGISVRLSLLDILGRTHNKKIAFQNVKIAQYEKEALEEEITLSVRKTYSELIALERLLGIASGKKQALQMNHQIAEKKFREGQLEISELGRVIELLSAAQGDYERSRLDVELKFLELESLVGVALH